MVSLKLLAFGTIVIVFIDVSTAHTKNRLCNRLCCPEKHHVDLKTDCDHICNECKTNDSVGGICEVRIRSDQLRGCSQSFTCALCKEECNAVQREDDESGEDIMDGSGDTAEYASHVTAAPTNTTTSKVSEKYLGENLENLRKDFDNTPVLQDSSWSLTDIHVALIITAVGLCFLIVCMLLFFAIRFLINERKLALSPINRGQYPASVFYTGKMTTISQGSVFNQPSSDFSSAWC